MWMQNNWLIKKDVIENLFEVLPIVNVNGINHYKNCKCRKRLINKLVEECSEDINGN